MNTKEIQKLFKEEITQTTPFPVLHHEWELDGYGYIVDVGSTQRVVLTNHGHPYIASMIDLQEIHDHYAKARSGLKEAMRIVSRKKT